MPKKLSLMLALVLVFSFSSVVRAQDVTPEPTVADDQVEVDNLPDPGSPFFGLQNAIAQVTQNFQLLVTTNVERKAQLEAAFAARDQALMEKIQNSDNPERFQKLLDNLKKREEKRLDNLQQHIEKLGARGASVSARLQNNLMKLQERKQNIEQKFEDRKKMLESQGASGEAKLQRLNEREQKYEDKAATREGKIQNRLEKKDSNLEKRIEIRSKQPEVRKLNEKNLESAVVRARQSKNTSESDDSKAEVENETKTEAEVENEVGEVNGVASTFWDAVKGMLGI